MIDAVNALTRRVSTVETESGTINTTLGEINKTLKTLNETAATTDTTLATIQGRIDNNDTALEGINSTLAETAAAMKNMSDTAMAQTRILTAHGNRFEKMDAYDRRKVVVMENCPEDAAENLTEIMVRLFKDTKLGWAKEVIESVERVGILRQNQDGGAQQQGRPQRKQRARPVKIMFVKATYKTPLMKSLKFLKNNDFWLGVSFGDELNEVEQRQYFDLRAMFFHAKSRNMNTQLRQKVILIDKNPYPHYRLGNLPYPELTMENATTANTPDGILFRSQYNRYSNLYPCQVKRNGEIFNCVEQAFQVQKAIICKNKRAETILRALTCPYKMMQEAKRINDTPEWARQAEGELYMCNKNKFEDPMLREHLKASGTKRMYEASFHPLWGSGFHLGQAERCIEANLRMENGHGRILERVRREINTEDGVPEAPEAVPEEEEEEEK